jgi:hypothetical protein
MQAAIAAVTVTGIKRFPIMAFSGGVAWMIRDNAAGRDKRAAA